MAPTVEKEMNGVANQTITPARNIIATYATMYANVRSANYKTTIVYIYIYIYIYQNSRRIWMLLIRAIYIYIYIYNILLVS